jgi:hypothetical protein
MIDSELFIQNGVESEINNFFIIVNFSSNVVLINVFHINMNNLINASNVDDDHIKRTFEIFSLIKIVKNMFELNSLMKLVFILYLSIYQ